MDATELEKHLGELEEKMERVRALYEQYFVGIEKIEPQIPRKDVDRIIVILRKVQIRNTAMRFKFQTLIQRYNTMQQHWARILREIENGTFKRDLIKAAARFGVDDALTAVGKKHAARLKNAVEKSGRGKQAKRAVEEEVYEELSSADLDEVAENYEDDDAPTPPPQAVPRARPQAYDITADPEPAYGSPQDAERRGAPSFQIEDPLAGTDSIPPPAPGQRDGFASTAEAPAYAPQGPAKKQGGLRWGGGGGGGMMRKADPEALKRIAGLAGGSVPEERNEAKPARRAEPEQARKPLLAGPLDFGLDDSVDEPAPAPPPKAAPPKAAAQRTEPARKPLLSAPLDLDLGLSPSEPPPPPAAKPEPKPPPKLAAPEPKPEPEPEPKPEPREAQSSGSSAAAERARKLELQRPKPALRPPPEEGAAKRQFGDLNDNRLRELYGQYVKAKRDRNESTAGITYEKLADSLKSQADKLKTQHGKRVDYEVVVKDGKTLIKPIVK